MFQNVICSVKILHTMLKLKLIFSLWKLMCCWKNKFVIYFASCAFISTDSLYFYIFKDVSHTAVFALHYQYHVLS